MPAAERASSKRPLPCAFGTSISSTPAPASCASSEPRAGDGATAAASLAAAPEAADASAICCCSNVSLSTSWKKDLRSRKPPCACISASDNTAAELGKVNLVTAKSYSDRSLAAGVIKKPCATPGPAASCPAVWAASSAPPSAASSSAASSAASAAPGVCEMQSEPMRSPLPFKITTSFTGRGVMLCGVIQPLRNSDIRM
mmetsp:Transcript_60302/g.197256  ORF Transcript_60302/g.197256 Transcript_60302/m.197256 type:complete len:200 (+) Transcript_60302:1684-2283(+)